MWISREDYVSLLVENSRLKAQVDNAAVEKAGLLADLSLCRGELSQERKRSDNAIDRLLNSKGLPAVTPPEKVDLEALASMFEETPEGIAAVRKRILDEGIEEVLLGEVR